MGSLDLSHKETNGSTVIPGDFCVHPRTGFVQPQMPLKRLPGEWEVWEATLATALSERFSSTERALLLSDQQKIVEEDKARAWRKTVEKMPVLSTDNLKGCERELRRAHYVLVVAVQIFTHTVPSAEPITVPRSLTIPLLRVSKELQHAPFITYSDHALNNWSHKEPLDEGALPTKDNIQSQITFTGTPDEDDFYMIDIHVELEGAVAVDLMRLVTDEITSSDNPDTSRVVGHLKGVAAAIEKMTEALMSTTKYVNADVFYDGIRPWLMGGNDDVWGRQWMWEGSEEVEGSAEMLMKTTGPNASQSPLVPALDAYLGLEEDVAKSAFLDRISLYMDRSHRAFLQHLRSNGRPVRSFVQNICNEQGTNSPVVTAYNAAVKAMKDFRDAHIIIVTFYAVITNRKRARNPGSFVTMQDKSSDTEAWSELGEKMQDEMSKSGASRDGNKQKGLAAFGDDQLAHVMKMLKGLRDLTNRGYICQLSD